MVSYKALNTIGKSKRTYRGDTGRKSEAGQAAAIGKSKRTYRGDTGRKSEAGQVYTFIKRITANFIHARRNF